ncbi:MAG: glycerophosphodiester phosphodiesterase family protein [Stackebrandtia sp.]
MTKRQITLAAYAAVGALTITGITLFSSSTAVAAPDCGSVFHVSHRGAGGLAPENTVAAMELAADNGADVFEVDVQLSKDGKVVIMHDTNLARTTNVEELYPGREGDPINSFTWDELEKLDAGSWFESRFAGEKIPSLPDVIEQAKPDGVGVVVELKDPALNPGLIEAVDAEMKADDRWADLIEAGRVTFSSFDAPELKQAKQLRPTVPVVWVTSLPADDATLKEAATWSDYYGTHYRTLGAGDIDRIEGHGLKSLLYTPDSPEAITASLETGTDAIITDFPNVATAVCDGTDPFPDANGIEITSVLANPDGPDTQPETGEHLVLTNTTDAAIDVSGYYIHDAVANTLKVGDGYSIPAGGELRVYTGPGTNTADRYYNGREANYFNNNGDSLGLFTPNHALLDVYAY